jgi:hypothetical protein
VSRFDDYWARRGEGRDGSRLDPEFIHWFNTRDRVRVRRTYPDGTVWERTGWVSATTGWRPMFLLMARSNSTGSSDLLDGRDRVVAVRRGGRYVPIH